MRKRILILDDHPDVRDGLSRLINLTPDLIVCGETGEIGPLWDLIDSSRPDLVIVDLKLNDGNGIDVIREIKNRHPRLPTLAVSMLSETPYASEIIEAGGRGYLMKSEAAEKVREAIRQVLQGNIYLSERMKKRNEHPALPVRANRGVP